MVMDPETHRIIRLDTPELQERAKDWTKFTVGEELTIKGEEFVITDIRPKSMVLKPKHLLPPKQQW